MLLDPCCQATSCFANVTGLTSSTCKLINNKRSLFHDELKNTKHLLEKDMYPSYLIDKQIKLFLNNKLSENDTPKENSNKQNKTYYKLP